MVETSAVLASAEDRVVDEAVAVLEPRQHGGRRGIQRGRAPSLRAASVRARHPVRARGPGGAGHRVVPAGRGGPFRGRLGYCRDREGIQRPGGGALARGGRRPGRRAADRGARAGARHPRRGEGRAGPDLRGPGRRGRRRAGRAACAAPGGSRGGRPGRDGRPRGRRRPDTGSRGSWRYHPGRPAQAQRHQRPDGQRHRRRAGEPARRWRARRRAPRRGGTAGLVRRP